MKFKETKEQIHVLFLPRWYPHRYDPMPGLFAQRHGVSAAAHARISVLYIHPDEHLKNKKYDITVSEFQGVFTVIVYFRKSKNQVQIIAKFTNLFRYILSHLKGFKLLKQNGEKPDLIHVHVLTRLGFLALIYKLLTGTPYLISEHWTRYLPERKEFKGLLRKVITRIITKNAKAVITVSEDLKKAMFGYKLINKNYLILPNVVDTELFRPLKNKSAENKKQFVHLSCFTDDHKNISGLLRVLKKLSEIRDDFKCILIGDGADFEKIKSYAKNLGLDELVYFTGMLEGKDVAEQLCRADALLMFSNHENLPVVMLESFACGVPVISTKVGGIHEHLNNERGCLVERGNEEELLNTLNTFLNHPENYDNEKIRDYAVQNFSNEVIGKKLFDIYLSILKNK